MRINRGALESLEPAQRREVERKLEKALSSLRANPLFGYKPTAPAQTAFHEGKQKSKLLTGGNRFGKSTAGVVDNLIQALDREAIPEELLPYKKWEPPFHCRIVTPDLKNTWHAVLTALRKWTPESELVDESWEKAYDRQNRILRFRNGSFIESLSYEMDLNKFGGSALHRVHFDEEPPGEKGEDIRTECWMRLIDYGGDEIMTMTPLFGLGWTFDEFWEQRGPEVISDRVWSNERLLIVRGDIDDNVHLSAEGKADALSRIKTDEERKVRKEGRFLHMKGLVYDEFDPDVHLCPRPPTDHVQALDHYVGIDPGIRTTAVVFVGFDADNHALVYDELYLSDHSAIPENAARAIKEKLAGWGVSPRYFIIDPSARNRNLVTAEQVSAAYHRAGIPVYPGQEAVEAGVFELKRRFQHDPPLMLWSEECVHLRFERDRYRIQDRPDGRFDVIKKHDHALDALRYVCMARPVAPMKLAREHPGRDRWEPGTAPPADYSNPLREQPPMGALS